MNLSVTAAWLLISMSAAGGETPSREPVAEPPRQFARLIIREQIIIRAPARIRRRAPDHFSPIEWKESKGPKCVAAKSIVGASLLGRNSVDLLLRDNSRIRAKLNDCPALDYYQGFYMTPHGDGKICADRDLIRSRVGATCEIERFRALKPVMRD